MTVAEPPVGQRFATVTGADAVHPAAVRQLFEAAEMPVAAATDAELAELLGGVAPLSTYLTFALPAWREPGRPLADGRLPPLPFHAITARYGDRAIATSVTVTAAGPLWFGDRLTSHWTLSAVTPRVTRLGPGVILDFETQFVTQRGDPVATDQTRILVFHPGAAAGQDGPTQPAAPLPLPPEVHGGPILGRAAPRVGQRTPEIRLGMSLQRLVMIAAANRDFAPVHHDPRGAAEIGAPAPIVNSMFLLTLAERVAIEAAGPDVLVLRLGPLRMLRPTPAGTTVVCYGRVAAVAPIARGTLITVNITFATEPGGLTARCAAEFVLSRAG